jgi:oligoendopeptidase F
MTYTNSADSMSTLAHELGHAYHSWVLRDEPVFLADYPMNLAETASTFAEAVLNEQRLQRAKTDYEKLSLLEGLLGDAVAFLMNIHARFLFENAFHLERAKEELTSKRLSELMEAAQKEAYLGALADGGWNPRFWASKLHFYITGLPFYNFPYTFGYLLSLGVYAVGHETGPSFPGQYRKLLMATGCQDAEDAVQSTLGFDLRGPEFWTKSLSIIANRVQQFRQLTDNLLGKTRTL